jgi:hypothetical protein
VVPAGVPVVPVVVVVGRTVEIHEAPFHIHPVIAWQVGDDVPGVQLGTTVLGVPVVLAEPVVVVEVVDELDPPQEAGGFGTLQSTVAAPLPGPRGGAPPPESCPLHDVNK